MTHQKIAQLVGVSPSTVSKALSGSKEVSEELREKIIKVAVESNYFKEKTKRRLDYVKENATAVAIICPEIISIHYSGIVTSIKNRIEAYGGQAAIYVFDFDDDKQNKIIENIVLRGAVDGIITFSSIKLATIPNIPIVCLCDHRINSFYSTIYCDYGQVFLDAVNHLKSLGHTRIGFVGESLTRSKNEAFRYAMTKNGLLIDESVIYKIPKRFEDVGYDAAEKMLKSNNIPSAVITAYDEIALGMIHTFTANGLRVPEDISVIGLNDIPYAAYSQVPLTTVRTFSDELYRLAVELLYDKILDKDHVIKHIITNHELVVRQSTGPYLPKESEMRSKK